MFSPLERMMAWRYLRARKAEGFVSVIATFSFLGIMLGVATLIIVMSVMNGFRAELVNRILGLNGHLNVYSQSGEIDNYMALVDRIERIAGVETVRPLIEGQVLISVSGSATGALVRAMSREDFATKITASTLKPSNCNEGASSLRCSTIQAGALSDFKEQQVAIGVNLADKLRLGIGSPITLLAPKGKATPFGTVPRSRTYTVGVIFDVGMYEYNSGFIFMDLKSAQQFFSLKDTVNAIEVMTLDPENNKSVKADVQDSVGGFASVYDWRDANSAFLNALAVERNVMFLILTLIILVAAFNIISSMIMLVKDKGKDIAIMRTMGATKRNILKIFVLTGASIGIAGTFFGAALGIAFAANIDAIKGVLESMTGAELFKDEIYFLSQLPAIIEWHNILGVVAMALVISIGATLYPAWRASRLDPVEALRYE
ncbi:MAG: lipoprotein-releasing ABC transporter permease subunit [Alphaproteobacteria bacterium]|nr:lipoprotein-releasing ABC transporter permease subunit [Alphaproteobacteria bacterium]NCQ88081.1 lipoprotein-releasing ABC transporter permease subunit [Alphaproteobacteria bacterium]NCT05412.1 lipoprotein-releasing ABC transporter permease subunit [Alphaproteobacteria bacterium]